MVVLAIILVVVGLIIGGIGAIGALAAVIGIALLGFWVVASIILVVATIVLKTLHFASGMD